MHSRLVRRLVAAADREGRPVNAFRPATLRRAAALVAALACCARPAAAAAGTPAPTPEQAADLGRQAYD